MLELNIENEMARLRWQCRRGMLELDVLLSNFIESQYAQLDDKKREVFKKILHYPDQVLFQWFLKKNLPQDPEIAEVVDLILK